ncbi:putative DNA topoisomerase [Vibrio nigripulchritudo SOn1]|uniref:DNA topoisomerase n=1 Tax=Vibrio nigripulchritudo SOn1 TaxID=1238450 RepID=A0AAV2VQ69_9VIBR|nr:DNA topoisomerase [Vibrio nigripulchritudo]CCO46789.1 putative DNA topoisomerase [Vibrio nigripulchritudo SOn1]
MLIVSEKYRTAAIIAKALGFRHFIDDHFENDRGDIVCFASGHLFTTVHDQPDVYDWQSPDNFNNLPRELLMVPNKFNVFIRGENVPSTTLLQSIIEKMRASDMIVNACDFDREGERIFYDIFNAADTTAHIYRMDLSKGLTRRLVCESYSNLLDGTMTKSRSYASSARNCGDFAYALATQVATFHARSGKLHPALTGYKEAKSSTLSLGRVQIPVLRFIGLRCQEVEQYHVRSINVPQLSTKISRYRCDFVYSPEKSGTDPALLEHPRLAKQYVNVRQQMSRQVKVLDISVEHVVFSPPSPHNTASIQGVMENLTPKETMDAMQGLYMKGLISYPRSDNNTLSSDHYSNGRLASLLDSLSRNDGFSVKDDGESLSDLARSLEHSDTPDCVQTHGSLAHSAIVPTDASPNEGQLNEAEQAVYNEICSRFVDSVKGETYGQEVSIAVAFTEEAVALLGEERSIFTCTKTIGEGDNKLTSLSVGDTFEVSDISVSQIWRDVPQYYTLSSLPLVMQEAGLGTAATRDTVIDTLLKRKYVDIIHEGGVKHVIITQRGLALLTIIPLEFKTPELTAEWENKLNEIEQCSDMEVADKLRREFVSGVFDKVQYLCRLFNTGQMNPKTSTAPAGDSHKKQVSLRASQLNIKIDMSEFVTTQQCHDFLLANPLPFHSREKIALGSTGHIVDDETLRDTRQVAIRRNQNAKAAPPSPQQMLTANQLALTVKLKVPPAAKKSAQKCHEFIQLCMSKRAPSPNQLKTVKKLARELEHPIPKEVLRSRQKVIELTKTLRKIKNSRVKR